MDMKITYKDQRNKHHQVILSKVCLRSSNKEDATEQIKDGENRKFEIVGIEELGEYGTYDYQKECRSLREKEVA